MAGLLIRAATNAQRIGEAFPRGALACQQRPKALCKCRPLSPLPLIVQRMHRFCGGYLLAGIMTLWAFQEASGAVSAASTVRILEAQGKVEILRANSTVWDKASTETNYNVLYAGDRLRTGANSRAAVMLSDESVVRIGESGHIEVRPAVRKKAGFSFLQGIFYFFHRDDPDELDLQTHTVSAVVRGTEFHLRVDENGRTVLSLIDGNVVMTNALGQIDLASGDEGVADPGARPVKGRMIEAVNIIQWCLYYPGVLYVDELGLSAAEQQSLSNSIAAYRAGDLGEALDKYPADRQAASDAEKVYLAAVLLSVGQVERSEALGTSLGSQSQNSSTGAAARALRKVVAAVKAQPFDKTLPGNLATEWLAQSYALQSQSDLTGALNAAYRAVQIAPNFGFGWERVAELEFSFGRIDHATKALDKSLQLAPRNAQ